jgi:hypothetical protein
MGFLHDMVSKFLASEAKPRVRVAGLFRSDRRLVITVAKGDTQNVVAIPLTQIRGSLKFSVTTTSLSDGLTQHRLDCGAEHAFLFDDEAEAKELLRRISCELAPSGWRYVRRFVYAWVAFYILTPSAPAPRPVQQNQALYVPARQAQPQAPIAAPITQGDAGHTASMPATNPSEAQPASNDPFGLRLAPQSN